MIVIKEKKIVFIFQSFIQLNHLFIRTWHCIWYAFIFLVMRILLKVWKPICTHLETKLLLGLCHDITRWEDSWVMTKIQQTNNLIFWVSFTLWVIHCFVTQWDQAMIRKHMWGLNNLTWVGFYDCVDSHKI